MSYCLQQYKGYHVLIEQYVQLYPVHTEFLILKPPMDWDLLDLLNQLNLTVLFVILFCIVVIQLLCVCCKSSQDS